MGKFWSEEEDEIIREMYGIYSTQYICDILQQNCNARKYNRQMVECRQRKCNMIPNELPEDMENMVWDMFNSGINVKKIASDTHISYWTLINLLPSPYPEQEKNEKFTILELLNMHKGKYLWKPTNFNFELLGEQYA